MASFVREVLSAAGTLGDKEGLAAKMAKIRKKLLDLKCQLQTHIETRYGSFSGSLAATSLLAAQLERLREELLQLDTTIAKHYKTELIGCNQELTELETSLQELTLTLQVCHSRIFGPQIGLEYKFAVLSADPFQEIKKVLFGLLVAVSRI
jgi:hypothetical protein